VNTTGTGPQSLPSNAITPSGAAPAWVTACSTQQYALGSSDGATWKDMDASRLALSFTPSVNSFAVITANADLWTQNSGYNQDLGVAVSGGGYPTAGGQPEAWKESGGGAGTFSPNAAFLQTVIPVAAGSPYSVKLQWKANHADPGIIMAGAGPIAGAFSPTRMTIRLIPVSSGLVFTKSIVKQPCLSGSDGTTWQDVDANLSVPFTPPNGNWLALVSGNADLWTLTPGFNQDLGIALTGSGYPTIGGQPEAWKESGGSAGTFSPNAAFVQTAIPVNGAAGYTAKLQWKANHAGASALCAGAGPIGSVYSPTRITVILVPNPGGAVSGGSVKQYNQQNSDGVAWPAMDGAALKLTLSPSSNTSYEISANADLWTVIAGYNQDIGLMVSGGAYGSGTLVAWKESGGSAGTYSPNAALVATDLHLQAGNIYTVSVVWKANHGPSGTSSIFAAAGPISTRFSLTSLQAVVLSQP
jgi:hypothetical protein